MTVKEQLGKHTVSEFLEHQNQIQEICKDNKDMCLLLMDIFNYGYMCGQRRERAKRKNSTQQGNTKGGVQ